MRVAAGVLLCIMAAVNILAGLGWAAGGGLMVGGGEIIEQTAQQAESEEGGEAVAETGDEGSGLFKAIGGVVMLYALWLLALAGLEIAGAVFLFKAQKAVFVIVVGALEGVTDIGAIIVAESLLFGVLGLIVAAFAVIGGVMLRREHQAGVA